MSDSKNNITLSDVLSRFLLPETSVTLKVVFDNLKNYAVCAVFVALAMALWKGTIPLIPPPKVGWTSMAYLVSTVASGLLILNLCQSVLIIRMTLAWMIPRSSLPAKNAPWNVAPLDTPIGSQWRRLGRWGLTEFLAVMGTMALVFVYAAGAVLAIYLVWFIAVGGHP